MHAMLTVRLQTMLNAHASQRDAAAAAADDDDDDDDDDDAKEE